MDAILDIPRNIPPHDAAPADLVPSRIITEWPQGTFVENICPLPDGSFAISVLSEGRIDRVAPDGTREVLWQSPASVTGIAFDGTRLLVAAGIPDRFGWAIWQLDPENGAARIRTIISDAAFLNGMALLDATTLLACEAAQGRIIRIDLARQTSATWFADPVLSRVAEAAFLPGANGLKIFGDRVYVTSNARALFLRIPIRADGSAGPIEKVAERLRADDFAFDRAGNAYLCTHLGHSLDRLDPSGRRVTLAGVAQGMAGSTACAFGLSEADSQSLFVTTTGGILGPPQGHLSSAKLVRLELGTAGAPLLPIGKAA